MEGFEVLVIAEIVAFLRSDELMMPCAPTRPPGACNAVVFGVV
jgi:hypothetical protein